MAPRTSGYNSYRPPSNTSTYRPNTGTYNPPTAPKPSTPAPPKTTNSSNTGSYKPPSAPKPLVTQNTQRSNTNPPNIGRYTPPTAAKQTAASTGITSNFSTVNANKKTAVTFSDIVKNASASISRAVANISTGKNNLASTPKPLVTQNTQRSNTNPPNIRRYTPPSTSKTPASATTQKPIVTVADTGRYTPPTATKQTSASSGTTSNLSTVNANKKTAVTFSDMVKNASVSISKAIANTADTAAAATKKTNSTQTAPIEIKTIQSAAKTVSSVNRTDSTLSKIKGNINNGINKLSTVLDNGVKKLSVTINKAVDAVVKKSKENDYLRVNSKGDGVKAVQEMLNKTGFNCGTADGSFGSKTQEALVAFQKTFGIKENGVVGNQSLTALKTMSAVSNAPTSVRNEAIKSLAKIPTGGIKDNDILMPADKLAMAFNNISALQKTTNGGKIKTEVIGNRIVITGANVLSNSGRNVEITTQPINAATANTDAGLLKSNIKTLRTSRLPEHREPLPEYLDNVSDVYGYERAAEIYKELEATGGDISKSKYKSYGIDPLTASFIELGYKLEPTGMTVAQYDYMTNARNYEAAAMLTGAAAASLTVRAANNLPKVPEPNSGITPPQSASTKGMGKTKGGSQALGIDEMVVSNPKFLNSKGDVDWEKFAPNGGYVTGSKVSGQSLETGTIIDRYGNQYGRYTSPVGLSYEQRSLPYIENPNAYHKYKVLKPIDNVTMGKIEKAFNQPGGGIQYELPANIKQLIKDRFLEEIK